jgi:hypothetical protein
MVLHITDIFSNTLSHNMKFNTLKVIILKLIKTDEVTDWEVNISYNTWKTKWFPPLIQNYEFCPPINVTQKPMPQDKQCKCNVITRWNHCCRLEVISITYSECASVALLMQHVKHMYHTIISPVASLALMYFSTLSHEGYNFQKKSYWTQNLCFDFICNVCVRHFSF